MSARPRYAASKAPRRRPLPALLALIVSAGTVCAQSFTIEASVSAEPVRTGDTVVISVRVMPTDGFDGIWSLAAYGLGYWDYYTTGGGGLPPYDHDAEIRFAALSRFHGTRPIMVEAMSAGITARDTVMLTVDASSELRGWTIYDESNSPLPGDRIYDLEIDRKGTTWIATSGGLARFDGSTWSTWDIGVLAGIEYPRPVTAIALDSSDGVWAVTDDIVGHYHNDAWTLFSLERGTVGFPRTNIRDVAVSPDGNVWLASDSIFRFDGTSWTNVASGADAWAIAVDPNGVVEACATWGFLRHDGERFRQHALPGLSLFSSPGEFARDNDNGWWYLFSGSIARHDGDSLYWIENRGFATSGMEENSSLDFAPDGSMWMGSYNTYEPRWSGGTGLAQIAGGDWRIYQESNSGLPENAVMVVRVGADGRVWIGTLTRGLAVFDPRVASSVPPESPRALAARIIPNPASGRALLALEHGAPAPMRLTIVDALGRDLRAIDGDVSGVGAASVPLDLDGLAAGAYFVRVAMGDRVFAVPLVVVGYTE